MRSSRIGTTWLCAFFLFAIGPSLSAWAADLPDATRPDTASDTQPTSWKAQLRVKKPPAGSRITGLTFSSSEVPISLRPQGDKLRPLIEIHGHFRRKGWALYVGNLELISAKATGERDFALFLYLRDRIDTATLRALGPGGATETEQIVLLSPDAQEFDIRPRWGELVVSAGIGFLYYYQSQYGNFGSRTGLLSLSYTNPSWQSRFGLLAKAETTILTLSSSPSGLGPQLIHAKLDGSYRFDPVLKKRLELKALLGASYLTMLSNGSPFGFANLLAPEIGVSAVYPLGPKSDWVGDFRYIPLSGIISFSQCGVDLVLGWTHTLSNRHRVELDLGYFDYAYKPDAATVVRAGALSLRFGYSI